MACGYVLQVGLLLESAESQTTRPDDVRLSNHDRTRASPLLKATDLDARPLDDGRYLLLALAFRQRFLASQYSSTELIKADLHLHLYLYFRRCHNLYLYLCMYLDLYMYMILSLYLYQYRQPQATSKT